MSRDGTDPVSVDAAMAALGGEDFEGSELLGMTVDGRYHLEDMLGRGGMGLVFRAAHIGLRRQVAVKILHPTLAMSSDVRNRFEREALAVGKIDHPNCVSVYDVGRLPDGSLYLAMELLEGKSLADVLEAEGQIAAGRALHILAHLLRGLSHIHQSGLIHRDIKPENIYLIRQGSDEDFAKILDFGIAKPMEKTSLDDGVKLTQAGMAFGTPIYMAPEQALGNPMDGRADLYAAAVLGYEMLCGQPPFYSEDKLEVMSMHTAKPVPPMRHRMIKGGRPVPSSIERLIVKGLTKKPSERYANADLFLAAVEDALRTPDGGVTDVNFERPRRDTGSRPLVGPDGELQIAEDEVTNEHGREAIEDAISEALSTPPPPGLPVVKARVATPPRGTTKSGTGVGLPSGKAALERMGIPGGLGSKATGLPSSLTEGQAVRGGVGIGLPYTGPTGEPIFGLTAEQRLSQAAANELSIASTLEPEFLPKTMPVVKSKRRRWILVAAVLAIALAGGVAIALLTAPDDDDHKIDPNSAAGRAMAELDRGNPSKALEILDAAKAETVNDPDAWLVRGHIMVGTTETATEGLNAYLKALSLDGSLAKNDQLQRSVRAAASSMDAYVAAGAFDVWITTKNPDAKPLLAKLVESDKIDRRKAARLVVEKHGLHAEVDLVNSYGLDLQQEDTCEKRKDAVAKLRALDDDRAIAVLAQAIEKKVNRKQYYSPCLHDDARAAMTYLRGLPKKAPPTKPGAQKKGAAPAVPKKK